MRVFIGIEFNQDVKEYCAKAQDVLRPNLKTGNLTRYDNFHLTLKYIGHVTNQQLEQIYDCVDEVSTLIQPFHIKIGGINTFHKGTSDIMWIGVTEGKKKLKQLFYEVERTIVEEGFAKEQRKYRPHVTLGKKMIYNGFSESNEFPYYSEHIDVSKITVFESHRVNGILTYTPLYEVDLEQ